MDEAHNIEDKCRDSSSFTFTESEIIALLDNLNEKRNFLKTFLFKFLNTNLNYVLENILYQDIHTLRRKTEGNVDNETDNSLILMEFQQSLETVIYKFLKYFLNNV